MFAKTQGTVILSSVYILGVLAFLNAFVPLAVLVLLILSVFFVLKNKMSFIFALVLFLFFTLACFNCSSRVKADDALSGHIFKSVKLQGIVVSIPTTDKPDRTKFYLKVQSIDAEKVDAKTIVTINDLKQRYKSIEVGDELLFNGNLYPSMRATNPSQFDYARYLAHKNVFTVFYVKDVSYKLISKPKGGVWKFLQFTNRCRTQIMDTHLRYLKSPNLELLGGMVFGDDAVNPPEHIKDSFRGSGLLHILAASGLNVALIFGIWFFIAQRLRLNYRFSLITGGVLICVYTCMTGFGASILRASLMLLFILFGKFIDRQANTTALLFFVAMLLLLYDPLMIYDIGFQLSFVVTLGLILMVALLCSKVQHKLLPEWLKGAIVVPIVAQLWVTPILMHYFNTLALYSIFANILSLPILTVVSFLGFTSSVMALIPNLGDKICFASDFILNYFLSAVVYVSNFFSSLPHSTLATFSPSVLQLALFYLMLIVFTLLIRRKSPNSNLIWIFVLTLVMFCSSLIPVKNDDLEIIFFDVQNADACLIKTPKNKYYLIDTGKSKSVRNYSQANSIIGKYLKNKGVTKLDALILTHFDSDHAGGALDMMKNFKVSQLVTPESVENTALAISIKDYVRSSSQNTFIVKNNSILIDEDGFVVKLFVAGTGSENDRSIITLVSFNKVNALFMGDAGSKSFEQIKTFLPNNINLLKVGHHGAKGSISKPMLARLKPQEAIISTGYNNFGHPDLDIIRLLHLGNTKVYRTDIFNAMKFVSDGISIEMAFFNPLTHSF